MIVKCVVSYINDNLTKGKKYEVKKSKGVFYIIKDDIGIEKGYAKSRFESTIKE